MLKRKDLTGQRFGLLTVVELSEPRNGKTCWRCQCDCGKVTIADASNLMQGRTRSCGDPRHRMSRKGVPHKHEDITGKRYGELTAVRYVKHDTWLWRCSCGRETVARVSSVKEGKVVSCGHVLAAASAERLRDGVHLPGVYKRIVEGVPRVSNTSGHTGVRIVHNVASVVYVARIMVDGQEIYLGRYGSMEAAVDARKTAEACYFGERCKVDE